MTYCMSHCGDRWQRNRVSLPYIQRECCSAFCINLMYIIGRTDLINFRCLAILLAEQVVRCVKLSMQSALISSNVACCCSDISLIELSKHCYCCNCSNIHQLTHKHKHSTVFLPSHTVLSSDISLIELSKHCYCSNCSNIHQLTHKHNHSTVFLPSHTVLSSVGTRSRLQNGI
jgi:hypothetical protein